MYLDYLSDELEGQGHRSQVAKMKKTIFGVSDGVTSAGSVVFYKSS